ncbi:YhfT family protein [Peribacillus sp. SCS-26]|uniref:YhfT family protein n=1 Tax=Paraperibacillus marinus TaxID=3115295 RepID=UPI003906B3D9
MLSPRFGFFFIAGTYLLNEAAGRPIVRIAVGPVGAIAVASLPIFWSPSESCRSRNNNVV